MARERDRRGLTRGAMAGHGLALIALMVCAVVLAGCALSVPSDPQGTLRRVTAGTLRVGVSVDPPLVVLAEDGKPSGALIGLAKGFASSVESEPRWTVGSEETLVGLLEEGELDLVVGGFTEQTPWSDRAGVTRGYTGVPGAEGRRIVMLVPMGENAMLVGLESFLDAEVGP